MCKSHQKNYITHLYNLCKNKKGFYTKLLPREIIQQLTKNLRGAIKINSENNGTAEAGTSAGGGGSSGPPPPRNFVKCLISPWFLGISGKSRTFIKNLDTCVKPFF